MKRGLQPYHNLMRDGFLQRPLSVYLAFSYPRKGTREHFRLAGFMWGLPMPFSATPFARLHGLGGIMPAQGSERGPWVRALTDAVAVLCVLLLPLVCFAHAAYIYCTTFVSSSLVLLHLDSI